MLMLSGKLGARRRYSQNFSSEGSLLCTIFCFLNFGSYSYNYHFLAGFILTLCLNLLTFFWIIVLIFWCFKDGDGGDRCRYFLWFLEEEGEKDFSGNGGTRWWTYYSLLNNSVFPPFRAPNRTLKLASMKYTLFFFINSLVVCNNFYGIIIIVIIMTNNDDDDDDDDIK